MTRLVLLPSPLLGPAVWQPAASELRARGWTVTVAGPVGPVETPADVVDGFLASVPDEPGLVLVPHSNAGLYAAPLAGARPVVATVFVDAGIPADWEPSPVAPDELVRHLEPLADEEGLLPPWSRWWGDEDLDALFPDGATRRRVEAEEQRLPLGYLRGTVPGRAGWAARPAAYLGFGGTYAGEIARARGRGWPVRVLDGGHLHMLVDPPQVAGAVDALAREVGVEP
jgi:hypothetical protein